MKSILLFVWNVLVRGVRLLLVLALMALPLPAAWVVVVLGPRKKAHPAKVLKKE